MESDKGMEYLAVVFFFISLHTTGVSYMLLALVFLSVSCEVRLMLCAG